MSPRRDATDPREWLRYARANLLHAEAGREAGVVIEYLLFDAQQAAEKALKGVLVPRGIHFKKTHDLAPLLTKTRESGLEPPELIRRAALLGACATQTRYPGWGESVEDADLTEALMLAHAVVDWAGQIIETAPSSE